MNQSFDETWEELHKSRQWGMYPTEHVIRFVARNYYSKDRKNVKILDFGCGGGAHTWYLAREGFDTYAFDGSKSAVERVKEKLSLEGLTADLRVRDGAALDYEENFFDCVIDNVSIYSNRLEPIRKMYQEIYKILKKGGKLLTSSFSTDTTGYGEGTRIEEGTYRDIPIGNLAGRGTAHFWREEELRETITQAGFVSLQVDTIRYTDNGNVVEQYVLTAEK